MNEKRLTHLQQLEAESIHIIREVAAEFANPVMLYSIGKDSSVMLHLARKAFYPGKLPFPLLHVDTGWKFREMYKFRDETARKYGFELLIHRNPEGEKLGINPFIHGSAKHTDIMKRYKTEVLPLRTELDTKLFELKDNDKSLKKEADEYNQLTMYSNMFLTVLATTGLYYFFFKLSK